MLLRHFADQFFEPNVGAIHQDFAPIFRIPDDVIFTRVDDVSIRFVVHGTSISHVYCILCGGKRTGIKGTPYIPIAGARGFTTLSGKPHAMRYA